MKNMLKKKINHRKTLLFRNKIVKKDKKQTAIFLENKFSSLEKKFGFNFKNKDLLIQAFIHRSFSNENKNFYLSDNERLEFLGDAVIELIVTEYLYKKYPDKAEGDLTTWRASLVNTQMLSSQIQKIGLNKFIFLSQGEQRDIEQRKLTKESILSNVFEAFIGAIYLDQGYIVSKKFIEKYLLKELSQIIKNDSFRNAKSKLQEYSQKEINITPTYQVLEEQGLDHLKTFEMGVFFNGELIARGKGFSKQKAELQAAKNALNKIKKQENKM